MIRALFCGVRGSTPSPGLQFVRYGGNTSCVALARDDGDYRLVLDAGTGLRRLAAACGQSPFRGTILLGHLHWDHTHGLPFFPAGDNPAGEVTLVMPAQGDPEAVLERTLSPPHFPITPRELRGDWQFVGLEEGEHQFEGFDVLALEIPHKGGRTYGYRISDGAGTLAYLSDHSPISYGEGPEGWGEYHDTALALARDVDLLVHDAQYTVAEFEARKTFGHSTIDYAVRLGEQAGARQVALFHHDPPRTDDDLDAIVASYRDAQVPVLAASEGLELKLPA